MPKSTTSFLVDINVWLAIAYDLHVHHDLAVHWFESIDAEQAVFCRLTQLGLLRLLTNSKVMGADVMGQSRAWQVFDKFLSDVRVRFLAEPEQMDPVFRRLTRSHRPATNAWADAYLGAIAEVSGLGVVSMDRVVANMTGVEAVILGRTS